MAKLVSKTYGDALFGVAVEEGRIGQFLDEVKAIRTALQENEDLNKLMNHPKIDKDEKVIILKNCFEKFVSKEIIGLLSMLVEKEHYNEVDKVLEYFIDQVNEYKGIGIAKITTAIELSKNQKDEIERKLLSTTDYNRFEMYFNIDPSIIGGMVIRIGDRVVDSSVKTKLYDLTRDLSKIQLKVGDNTP
ncbi:ATP synthase F1 subunit delta [Lachnobacterium bovis]|jgi:F-type H+-transporting ATPase subunit delta|uniref:ATP synthase subunit delta n=1 Tax=Lachnobacterium bovis DSM 14045 TaxID=1122142 RepID=A0A1H3G7D8_9FIRM|nr:ATP synthase F1 subunit delta [Lachnobacterium bovis]SDX99196.1 F-type H+-transporting ATPase subunit delta [Lachnobacterium bovis DSM 14045]